MDLGLSLDGGTLQRLPPNASLEEQLASLNDVITRLNDLLKSQVLSDGTSKRFVQGYLAGRWPGGDFGIAIAAEGDDVTTVTFNQLLFAWDFSTNTQYWYDQTTGKNYLQIGTLPNGSGGFAVAKTGKDVADIY